MSTINKMTTINRRDNTTSSTDAATEISLLEPIDALESSNPFYKVDVVIKLDSSTTLTAGLNQAEVNLTTYISYNMLIKRYKEFADILQSTPPIALVDLIGPFRGGTVVTTIGEPTVSLTANKMNAIREILYIFFPSAYNGKKVMATGYRYYKASASTTTFYINQYITMTNNNIVIGSYNKTTTTSFNGKGDVWVKTVPISWDADIV